ncbi:hypothetical protein EGR_05151 [Echinococcus granulosus]|uniref:Golgi apparatus membrane protein TVP23 homolog n=2 Tax=Echinococcus granulosus TaxID=6210 RepID=W6UF16_ECHGR|nr:hypothetical protein EGR_05151 [Echinococcus granulosus]EUB59990.1 hypothetical protein EGR_05151 [Echinococcus granulosus]
MGAVFHSNHLLGVWLLQKVPVVPQAAMDASARDDVVLTLTEADDTSSRQIVKRRRLALLCHFGVRSTALIFYLLCSWFTTAFIAPVVTLLTLFAIDFWLVKNVSGRLLVGLRWWNSIDLETGTSKWVFESVNSTARGDESVSSRERASRRSAARLFWLGLLIFPVIWVILVLVAVFSLKLAWCLVAACGCLAGSINAYGYLRCRFKGSPIGGDSQGSGFRGLLTTKMAKIVISDLWSNEENQQQQPPSII